MLGVSGREHSSSHSLCKQEVPRPPLPSGFVSSSPRTQSIFALRAGFVPLHFGPPLSLAWGCQRGGKIIKIPGIEPLEPGGSPGGEKVDYRPLGLEGLGLGVRGRGIVGFLKSGREKAQDPTPTGLRSTL